MCMRWKLGDALPGSLIIDMRGRDEFVGPLGHIEGAHNSRWPS